jgi:hypothetical protein
MKVDAHQHLGKACYEGVDAVFQERRSVLCRLHSKAETQHPICDSHTTVHSISKLLLSSELVETGFIDHLLKEINYPSSPDGVPSQILLPLKIHLSSTQTTLAGAGEKGKSLTKASPRIVQKLKYSLQAPEVNTSTTEFSSDSFLTFALCNSELPSGSLTIRSCGLNSGGRTLFTKVCLKILAIFSASSSSKFPWHRASIYVCKFSAVRYQIKIAEARGTRQKNQSPR